MRREWKAEWMKVRHRHIGLLLAVFLGVVLLWGCWNLGDVPENQIWDGYRMCFQQIPIINTVLLPTMIAVLASRLCDAEIKGDTLKLLCTLEKKGRLFDMKLLMGALYLALYVDAEVLLILAWGKGFHFGRPLEPMQLLYFAMSMYTVSMVIYLLQQVLSFAFENQIFPLAAGLLGSFAGLFCWYLPVHSIQRLIPWGYYAELCFIGFHWDEQTRVVTYYDIPFDFVALGILLMVLILGYGLGKWLFVRKEI